MAKPESKSPKKTAVRVDERSYTKVVTDLGDEKEYAVGVDKNTGVCKDHGYANELVHGMPGGQMKALSKNKLQEAQAYVIDQQTETAKEGSVRAYVVFKGKVPGVYFTEAAALRQTDGFQGGSCQLFRTRAEAESIWAKRCSMEAAAAAAAFPPISAIEAPKGKEVGLSRGSALGEWSQRNEALTAALNAFHDFLEKGLAPSTEKEYEKKFKYWLFFVKSIFGSSRQEEVLLKKFSTTKEKSEIWALFIWFLRIASGISADAVDNHVAAVKHKLGLLMGENEFMDASTPIVRQALLAAKSKTKDELRAQLAKTERLVKLPMFDELTQTIYEECWVKTSWQVPDDFPRKAVWVATVLMDIFGFRPSNVVRPEKDATDHTLEAQDLLFLRRNADGTGSSIRGDSVEAKSLVSESVFEVQFAVLSAKRSVKPIRKGISRSDERGARAIDTLVEWVHHANLLPKDYLTTFRRPAPHRKGHPLVARTVSSHEVTTEVKKAAVILDLPPEHFSPCSFRKGLVTRDSLAGVEASDTAATGNWRSQKVMKKHYDKSDRIYGFRKAGTKVTLDTATVEQMLPVEKRIKRGPQRFELEPTLNAIPVMRPSRKRGGSLPGTEPNPEAASKSKRRRTSAPTATPNHEDAREVGGASTR